MPVTVGRILGDIAQLEGYDAVVNAANDRLANGAGVTGALFGAADPATIAAEVANIPADDGVKCPTGKARITGSGNLAASDIGHIIHTVAPRVDMNKLKNADYANLFSAYYAVLAVADSQRLNKITWPLLGAGIYGWTEEVSMAVGLAAIAYYNEQYPDSHLHVDFCLWEGMKVRPVYFNKLFDAWAKVNYTYPNDTKPWGYEKYLYSFWVNLHISLPSAFRKACKNIDGAAMAAKNPRYAPGALDVAPAPAPEAGAAPAPAPEAGAAPAPAPVPAAIGRGGPLAPAPAKARPVAVRQEWTLWDCMNEVLVKYQDKYGQAKRDSIADRPVFDMMLTEEQRVQEICTFLEEGKGGYFSGDFAENGIRALIAWELYNNLGGKGVGLKSKQSALCGALPKPEKGIRHNLRWETDATRPMLLDALRAEYPAPVAISRACAH